MKGKVSKQCTKCGEVKNTGDFYLVKNRHGNRVVDSWCKECRIKGSARHRKVHPAGIYQDPHDGRLRVYEGKRSGRKVYWNDNMLSVVKKYYPNTSNVEVAEMIGVSAKLVSAKAKELGLSKAKTYITEYCKRGALLRAINNRSRNNKQKG